MKLFLFYLFHPLIKLFSLLIYMYIKSQDRSLNINYIIILHLQARSPHNQEESTQTHKDLQQRPNLLLTLVRSILWHPNQATIGDHCMEQKQSIMPTQIADL